MHSSDRKTSQQCLACNRTVARLSKVCACGHVLSEKKMIGNRRYSEYRAKQYSRLFHKSTRRIRMRDGTRDVAEQTTNIQQVSEETSSTNHQSGQRVVLESTAARVPSKHQEKYDSAEDFSDDKQSNEKKTRRTNKSSKEKAAPYIELWDMLFKDDRNITANAMTQALNDINTRILGQSRVWFTLRHNSK